MDFQPEKNIKSLNVKTIQFGSQAVQCEIVALGDQKADDFTITVDDLSNEEQINDAAKRLLYVKYWHLLDQYQNETLRQKFEISLDENTKVDIYDFREKAEASDIEEIGKTLYRYYHALKDKSDWNLPSIQIRSKDELNPVSGEPYRGITIGDNRVEIFPATFATGKYRDKLDCTWLQGAVAHEPTHAGIQRTKLDKEWIKEDNPFGWKRIQNGRILLPGGDTTDWYCERWQDCPTGYGSLLPGEDVPESVVAYLYDQSKLDSARMEILSKHFHPIEAENDIIPTIAEKSPLLPATPKVTLKVRESVKGMFFSKKVTRNELPPPIPIDEYRKMQMG